MKTIYYLIVLNYFYLGCNLSNHDLSETHKIIPDNTPFITGIIEASSDSTFYYPQVTVGYVTDADFSKENRVLKNIPGLFSPTQLIQIYKTVHSFGLTYDIVNDANVQLKGPLDHEDERIVTFENEGFGVYGDVNKELILVPNYSYELIVEMNDNSVFIAHTTIPKATDNNVPKSIKLDVVLKHYQDGTPREESIATVYTYFTQPRNSLLFEIQVNTNYDRYYSYLEPEEVFPFSDRSEFHRIGSFYGVFTNLQGSDSIKVGWSRTIDKTAVNEYPFEIEYHRYGYYGSGMWKNFQVLDNYFTESGDLWSEIFFENDRALREQDSTYLKRVSTIDEIGPDGEILPKDEANVIGFFAGSFAVYKKTVVYPIRNFDIDSVLTAHGLNND